MDAKEITPNLPVVIEVPIPKQRKEIWFLHGTNSSPTAFVYLKDKLRADPDFKGFHLIDVSYNCQDNLNNLVKIMTASARKNVSIYIVGHSLGGVLATAIAQKVKRNELTDIDIKGVFTISSPFGGSESADYLRWLYPTYHLFRSISTTSRIITDLLADGMAVPTTSIVSTAGNNPLFSTANDGVVTIRSQRALKGPNYIEINHNHFESLLSMDTLEHLKLFLKNN